VSDDARPALRVWPFALAPAAYQALSGHTREAVWVWFIPQALREVKWPYALTYVLERQHHPYPCVSGWGYAEYHEVAGGLVVIFA
jgi:hypothetical protein